MYRDDGLPQKVSNSVFDVKAMGTLERHVKEVGHVGKMDARNHTMCSYIELTIGRGEPNQSAA